MNVDHGAFSCASGLRVTAFQLKGVGGYHDDDPLGENDGSSNRIHCSGNTSRVESDWFHLLDVGGHGWRLVRGWTANDRFFPEDWVTADRDGQLWGTDSSPSTVRFPGGRQ